MKRILVAYATMAGSTADVAYVIGEEIARRGIEVGILPAAYVKDIGGFDGVVVGGPMILGFHRDALGFIRRHRAELQRVPLAVFVTAMSLTQTGETSVGGVPVSVDERLPAPPEKEGRLTFKERYATLSNYLGPVLRAAGGAKPVRIGVFGGRLEYGRLKWWAVLLAMVVIQARAGDRRSWPAIRAWAAGLPAAFGLLETDGGGQ